MWTRLKKIILYLRHCKPARQYAQLNLYKPCVLQCFTVRRAIYSWKHGVPTKLQPRQTQMTLGQILIHVAALKNANRENMITRWKNEHAVFNMFKITRHSANLLSSLETKKVVSRAVVVLRPWGSGNSISITNKVDRSLSWPAGVFIKNFSLPRFRLQAR